MESPSLNTADETFRTLTVYLTAQLKPDAETRPMVAPVEAVWGDLKAAADNHEAQVDAMVAALALRDRVDVQVDDFVRAQFRTAQGVYGATSKKLGELYPGGLTPLIKGTVSEQPSGMRVLATRLEADGSEAVAAGAAPIREKAATLKEVVDMFAASVEQVATAWSRVLKARAEWIRMYEKTFGELVALVGKKKANTYFKKTTKQKKKKPTV